MPVRCKSCFWYDKDSGQCILFEQYIYLPTLPRRCPYYNMVPRAAINYLKKMTDLVENEETNISDVYNSEPYKKYLKMFRLMRYERVE